MIVVVRHCYCEALRGLSTSFHRLILEQVIKSQENFESGLDSGCGTSYSAVAFAHKDQTRPKSERQRVKLARPRTYEGLLISSRS